MNEVNMWCCIFYSYLDIKSWLIHSFSWASYTVEKGSGLLSLFWSNPIVSYSSQRNTQQRPCAAPLTSVRHNHVGHATIHHSFTSPIMSVSCYESQTTLHCISIRVDGNTTVCSTAADSTMSPLIVEVCKTKRSPVGHGAKQDTRADEWVLKWSYFSWYINRNSENTYYPS